MGRELREKERRDRELTFGLGHGFWRWLEWMGVVVWWGGGWEGRRKDEGGSQKDREEGRGRKGKKQLESSTACV